MLKLKNFIKKIAKIFGQLKKVNYFCRWRDGRVVDCGGLENRWTERFRGFESLSFRSKKSDDFFHRFFVFAWKRGLRSVGGGVANLSSRSSIAAQLVVKQYCFLRVWRCVFFAKTINLTRYFIVDGTSPICSTRLYKPSQICTVQRNTCSLLPLLRAEYVPQNDWLRCTNQRR